MDRRSTAGWLLAALGAAFLLAANMGRALDAPLERTAPPGFRCWDDFGVAVRLFRGDRAGARAAFPSDFEAARHEIDRLELRPWQFWRTADEAAFPGVRALDAIRPLDDTGRGRLLAVLFRLRGGIAPRMPFWMAPLFALPALVWIGWECARARHGIAGALFVLALASSAFVVDVLPLSYSAAGFYVAAVLLLVPWAVYAAAGSPSVRGLLVRAGLVGGALGACVYCRTGVLLVLPGFLVALAVAAARLPRTRRVTIVLASAALLCGPPLWVRTRMGGHEIWITLWEGLGDFDRSKGHVWSDAAAKRMVRQHGVDELRSQEAQDALREDVLRAVRSDPAWYGDILGRRLLATLGQWKLWGRGMRPSTRPGEGAIDGYYGLARPVDTFVLGSRTVEVPVPLLLAGPVLLGALAVGARGGGRRAAMAGLVVMLALCAGTLAVPVLVSTAGAFETETVALAWLLAWSFVVEAAVDARERRSASSRSTIRP